MHDPLAFKFTLVPLSPDPAAAFGSAVPCGTVRKLSVAQVGESERAAERGMTSVLRLEVMIIERDIDERRLSGIGKHVAGVGVGVGEDEAADEDSPVVVPVSLVSRWITRFWLPLLAIAREVVEGTM